MNISIFKDLADLLIHLNDDFEITNELTSLSNAIQKMASQPQEPQFQTEFAASLQRLRNSLDAMTLELRPTDWARLKEIHGTEFFDQKMIEAIDRTIADNPATPNVINEYIQSLIERRQEFLSRITAVSNNLSALQVVGEDVERVESQIGFTLPRTLFHNSFSNLLNELSFIKMFVKHVAEVEGESFEDVEIGQISTSDPLFWLVVGFGIASTVGKITKWGLDCWKSAEEIRKLRREVSQNASFSEAEVKQMFDDKIDNLLKNSIEAQAKHLVEKSKLKADRKNELENAFKWLLKDFLARIERGLTVEIKLLEPPIDDDEKEEEPEISDAQQAIREIAAQLHFPKPIGDPILALNAPPEEGALESQGK